MCAGCQAFRRWWAIDCASSRAWTMRSSKASVWARWGWIAGLVNAFPVESVRLLDLALSGRRAEAAALYAWFLPLLRLDTVPKFVQHIKLVQQEVGRGHERVRPPRLVLHGAERDETLRLIRHAVATLPV